MWYLHHKWFAFSSTSILNLSLMRRNAIQIGYDVRRNVSATAADASEPSDGSRLVRLLAAV